VSRGGDGDDCLGRLGEGERERERDRERDRDSRLLWLDLDLDVDLERRLGDLLGGERDLLRGGERERERELERIGSNLHPGAGEPFAHCSLIGRPSTKPFFIP